MGGRGASSRSAPNRNTYPDPVAGQAIVGETYDGVTYRMTRNDLKKVVPEDERLKAAAEALAALDAEKARLGRKYPLRKRELARQQLMSSPEYRLGLGQGKLDRIRGVSYTEARTTSAYNMGYHEGWNDNPSHWKQQRATNPNFWAHDNKKPVRKRR